MASLGFALDTTLRGLLSTSTRIALVSQNITNAGKDGYSRKEASESYVTTNAGTVPIKTNILDTNDRYLTKSVVNDSSGMGKNQAISEILEYYSGLMGSTDGSTTIPGYLNNLYSSLQQLATDPETLASKTETVQTAQNLTNSLRTLSGNIQQLRQQAENKITDTIKAVNDSIDTINKINSSTIGGNASDAQKADAEDQRTTALQTLAKNIDIQYYYTSDNRVQVYTTGGQPLVTSVAHPISYTPTTYISSISTFQPIMLGGVDITNQIQGGTLAGNIAIRDTILPDQQSKLDQFSTVLSDRINTILNKGASLPPQTTMTGTTLGLTNATALSATGNLRVAIVNTNGVLQNYTDVNLSTVTTVGGLLTTLNAIPNISASLTPDGALQITSTLANSGVSLDELNSNVAPAGKGASYFFGMQNMFTGTNAATLDVNSYLLANPNYLASGSLVSGALTVGDKVLTKGDGSVALAMSQALKTNTTFGTAGDFSSQTNTLNNYIESIIADGATKSKLAQTSYETSNQIYSHTKATMDNKSGVNVDEETTKMLALQNSYEASARMISTIKSMFESLIQAVG